VQLSSGQVTSYIIWTFGNSWSRPSDFYNRPDWPFQSNKTWFLALKSRRRPWDPSPDSECPAVHSLLGLPLFSLCLKKLKSVLNTSA